MRSKKIKSSDHPVVFLHGFLGNAQDWERILPNFPKGSAINLPGHANELVYSLDTLYNAIPENSHLVGYSLGGRIALRLLFSYPPKFSSLSLLSAHPGLETSEQKQQRLESDLNWATLLDTLSIEEFLHKWYNRPLFANSPIPKQRKEQNMKALKEVLLTYSLAKQPSYWDAIEKSTTPLLFLFGEKDHAFLPIYHRLSQMPHISTQCIPNATHALVLEAPEICSKFLQEFIQIARNNLIFY